MIVRLQVLDARCLLHHKQPVDEALWVVDRLRHQFDQLQLDLQIVDAALDLLRAVLHRFKLVVADVLNAVHELNLDVRLDVVGEELQRVPQVLYALEDLLGGDDRLVKVLIRFNLRSGFTQELIEDFEELLGRLLALIDRVGRILAT